MEDPLAGGEREVDAVAELVAPSPPASVSSDGCPPGKIRNPATGRCVNVDGKIGQAIVAGRVRPSGSPVVPARVPGNPTGGSKSGNSSKEECVEIPHGKWSGGERRKAPPFHSKPCAGQVKKGLDGKSYIVPGAGGMGEVINNSWC